MPRVSLLLAFLAKIEKKKKNRIYLAVYWDVEIATAYWVPISYNNNYYDVILVWIMKWYEMVCTGSIKAPVLEVCISKKDQSNLGSDHA